MITLKILVDVNLKQAILDLITAREVGLDKAPDEIILQHAISENRILLTHDERTVPRIVYQYIQQGVNVPGVIVVPQGLPIRKAIEDLELILVAGKPADLENRVLRLPL